MARLDVLRAEVDLANARARRIQVQANLDQAYQSLRTVLALPQSQPLHLRGTLDDLLVPESRDALAAALPNRPDLRAFESRREMAEYAVDLANAEWKPTLAFTGNVAYQDDSATTLLDCGQPELQFGVALRMPLLAAPGSAARRGVAKAQMRQAEHGLNAALDAGRLELETAWTDLQAATEVVATQQKALELARESVTIAEVSYENGVITSAELNDAQVALLQTDLLLQQAKYAPHPGRRPRPLRRRHVVGRPLGRAARGSARRRRAATRASRSGARSGRRTPARCRRGSARRGARAPRSRRRCPSRRAPGQRPALRQPLHQPAAEGVADAGRIDDPVGRHGVARRRGRRRCARCCRARRG